MNRTAGNRDDKCSDCSISIPTACPNNYSRLICFVILGYLIIFTLLERERMRILYSNKDKNKTNSNVNCANLGTYALVSSSELCSQLIQA